MRSKMQRLIDWLRIIITAPIMIPILLVIIFIILIVRVGEWLLEPWFRKENKP